MRLSISIICFIELIILKLSYSYSCENTECNTGYERCVCSDCIEANTVGIIFDANCFFIELNRTTESSENTTDSIRTLHNVIHNQVTRYHSTVIQILTRHAYKALDIKQIAFDARDAAVFKVDLKYPSKSRCAVYKIRKYNTHLINEDRCDSMEKVFVDSTYYHGSAYRFSLPHYNHNQFDRRNFYSCFPNKKTRACAFLKTSSSKCKQLFKVANRVTYSFMESFSLLKLKQDNIMYKAFLVEYDPQDYKLTKDDYYMAVSTENNRADIQSRHTSSSNTSKPSCYIADAIAGKLFGQTSCEAAIANLKAKYFYGLNDYTSMCRVPKADIEEYLKTKVVETSKPTVTESEIKYENDTIVVFQNTSQLFDNGNSTKLPISSDNDTINIIQNTSQLDSSDSTNIPISSDNNTLFQNTSQQFKVSNQDKTLTNSPPNSIENVTTVFSSTPNPGIDGYNRRN